METLGFGVNSAGFRTRFQGFYEDILGSAGYTGLGRWRSKWTTEWIFSW